MMPVALLLKNRIKKTTSANRNQICRAIFPARAVLNLKLLWLGHRIGFFAECVEYCLLGNEENLHLITYFFPPPAINTSHLGQLPWWALWLRAHLRVHLSISACSEFAPIISVKRRRKKTYIFQNLLIIPAKVWFWLLFLQFRKSSEYIFS